MSAETGAVVAEISRYADSLARAADGSHDQFQRCRDAGNALARAVDEFLYVPQPDANDRRLLREAWTAFMQQDSGNFASPLTK